jgi:VIT1/CCC1 family predicted Fe2+/Mn2+ transporter
MVAIPVSETGWYSTSILTVTEETVSSHTTTIASIIGVFLVVLPRSLLNSGVVAVLAVAHAAVNRVSLVVLVHMSERLYSIHRSKVDGVTQWS